MASKPVRPAILGLVIGALGGTPVQAQPAAMIKDIRTAQPDPQPYPSVPFHFVEFGGRLYFTIAPDIADRFRPAKA